MKANGSEELEPGSAAPSSEEESLVPASSIVDLSTQLGRGIDIIKARAQILETARKAAIRMTSPEDWVRYRDPKTGIEIAYLQDAGCQRMRGVFGISTYSVSAPEKIMMADGNFVYVVTGSGRCGLTQESLENVEGARSSADDFITRQNPPLKGAQLEMAVRKAARANLEGNITRKLAGLGSVPYLEIEAIFKEDRTKTENRFRKGRGFGTQQQRQPLAVPARTEEVSAPPPVEPEKSASAVIGASLASDLERLAQRMGWKLPELMVHIKAKYGVDQLWKLPKDEFEEVRGFVESGVIEEK
jgi:hypothetical protein